MSKKTWVQTMDDVLEKKKAKGMIGIKYDIDGDASIEEKAEAFCKIEKRRGEGFFAKTTSKTL